MHKFVVIQVNGHLPLKHEPATEYLTEELQAGWRIISCSVAGASNDTHGCFLVAVVLEKPAGPAPQRATPWIRRLAQRVMTWRDTP